MSIRPLVRWTPRLAAVALAASVRAQCPEWSPALAFPGTPFAHEAGPVPGMNTEGLAVHDFGSGPELCVSGRVRSFPPGTRTRVLRWTGSGWGTLYESALQPADSPQRRTELRSGGPGDGGLYAGTSVVSGTTWEATIERFDGAGWSALGALPNAELVDFGVLDAGGGPQLLALARSEAAPGSYVSRLQAWNGSDWSQLGADLADGARALASFDAGGGPRLVVGGTQALLGSSPVVRWNGAAWEELAGLDARVRALCVFGTPGELHAACAGTLALGDPTPALWRWDGAAWSAAAAEHGFVARAAVADLGAGARLVLGGSFPTAAAAPTLRVWDGLALAPFAAPTNVDGALRFLEPYGSGGLLLGGDFRLLNTRFMAGLARWSGGAWSALGAGFDGPVHTLAAYDFGSGPVLLAGGSFGAAGNSTGLDHVARRSATGWEAANAPFDLLVDALFAVDLGGGAALFASGASSAPAAQRVARWNGSDWNFLGPDFGAPIRALDVFDAGFGLRLIAAGAFTVTSGAPGQHIAAWNAAGWTPLGAGLDGDVFALARHADAGGERLIAGGRFTHAGGATARRVARWNGFFWSALGSGFDDGAVEALASFDAGPLDPGDGPQLYAGGSFSAAGGLPRAAIARWDGSTWSDLPGGGADGTIHALCVHDDGRGPALYVGGRFTHIGGITAYNLARFDGAAWEAVFGGTDGPVRALRAFDDDGDGRAELFAAGEFTRTGTHDSGRIARLAPCPTYSAICAGDGTLVDHTTPCPCANLGAAGHGCANSVVSAGAQLVPTGTLQPDTLVLTASGQPQSVFGLFLQHDAAGDQPFHDGVLCAGGALARLRGRFAVGGVSSFPDALDTATASQRGQVVPGSGSTRYYALLYRNASTTFCPPAQANVTNGVRVVW